MRHVSVSALRDAVGIALLLTLVVVSSAACAGRRGLSHEQMWGPFRGRFVDADTGQPIRGGVAYAVWYRIVFHPVHDRQEFYAVQFAVTNEDGEYEIPPLDNAPLLARWYDGPFHASVVPGHQLADATASDSYVVTKWRPFSRIRAAERRYGGAPYTGLIPDARLRAMLDQINTARRQMGLPPLKSLGGGL